MSAPAVHETGEAVQPGGGSLLDNHGKIVFVDPTGTPGTDCDFNTIADASTYLHTLPGKVGGFIILAGNKTHQVSTVVDVMGLEIRGGRYAPAPIIQAVTGGKLLVDGTRFRGVIISVPGTFAGTYFLEFTASAKGDYHKVDFQPSTGKYIFGTTVGPWNIELTYRITGQSLQQGGMFDPSGVYNILKPLVYSSTGAGPLQFGTRNVWCDEGGRFDTTGHITGLPAGLLTVAPGESIQSRLNSLIGIGGKVTLLPGVHTIYAPLKLLDDSIILDGDSKSAHVRVMEPFTRTQYMNNFGSPQPYINCVPTDVGKPVVGSISGATGILLSYNNTTRQWIISTSGISFQTNDILTITGGTGSAKLNYTFPYMWEACVMIGDKFNGIIVNQCVVDGIQLDQYTYGPNGYYAYGGHDNEFLDSEACAFADMSWSLGPSSIFWTGFVHSDSILAPCIRPVMRSCRVSSDGPTHRYCDAFHVDGINYTSWCVYGHNNRIIDASIFLCAVDTCDETSYIFTGVTGGVILANQCRNAPYHADSIVSGLVDCYDVEVQGNDFIDCPPTGDGGFAVIGIDGCGRIVFNANTFDSGYRYLTMQSSGYVNCVPTDIGKQVVGAPPGSTGVLIAYDNTTRIWTVRTDLPFPVGNVCTITSGTGQGTVSTSNHYKWNAIFEFIRTGDLINYNSKIQVVNNTMKGAVVGIDLDATSNDFTIGPNEYEDITTTVTDASTLNKYMGSFKKGAGPPVALVGNFGDEYFDTTGAPGLQVYKQTGYPTGTTWVVIG